MVSHAFFGCFVVVVNVVLCFFFLLNKGTLCRYFQKKSTTFLLKTRFHYFYLSCFFFLHFFMYVSGRVAFFAFQLSQLVAGFIYPQQ